MGNTMQHNTQISVHIGVLNEKNHGKAANLWGMVHNNWRFSVTTKFAVGLHAHI